MEKQFIIAVLSLMLISCAPVETHELDVASQAAKSKADAIVAEIKAEGKIAKSREGLPEKWQLIVDGSTLREDVNHEWAANELHLENGGIIPRDTWESITKPLIESRPKEERDALTRMLSRHWHGYDDIERQVDIRPLRYLSGPYHAHSYIAGRGAIKDGKMEGAIFIRYLAKDWLFIDSITVAADEFRWKKDIEFNYEQVKLKREALGNSLPMIEETGVLLLPQEMEIVERIASSKSATIRLHGINAKTDIEVTERFKSDLNYFLTVYRNMQ